MRVTALLGAGLTAAIMTAANPMARQTPQAASGQQTQQQQQPPPTQDPQQPRPPPIKSGINFVRVDAIVTDRQGKPVLDMKQEEFRVKEDGKAQTIESFESRHRRRLSGRRAA
jgi:hypothetical protein